MNNPNSLLHTDAEKDQNFSLFSQIDSQHHEQIVICSELESGLRAIIAIHDTTLGPSLGGVRMWPYDNETDALKDVLRLSRAMTYKAAISGLNLGGGKSVIIGDPNTDQSEAMFRALGRYIEGLGGRYIATEDVGMSEQCMEWIYSETNYVTGIPEEIGGNGDPSPVTAYGVYMGMKACVKKTYGGDSLEGKRIAIQGAGNVASHLASLLQEEGAILYVSDLYPEKAKTLAERTGAETVKSEEIYELDADIFSPCALGGIINDRTIGQFKFDIIAGGANNVLLDEQRHGQSLSERGILYAPDYVINAGGLIHVAGEFAGYDSTRSYKKAAAIYDTVLSVLNRAEEENVPPLIASNAMAEERIKAVGGTGSMYLPGEGELERGR
ncbi:MAG: Glu/Leu/Phe/Val dehydrogenase dimerization domain-containing protein [Balneolaceae bacterium]